MTFTEKQKNVLRNSSHRWNILSGAVRSGKTYASYFDAPLSIREHLDNNVMFIGKTVNTIDRNVFDPMREIYGSDIVSKLIDKKEIYLFGKRCYVVGANDDRAITKIQGTSLGFAYGDEITTWPENFWNMLKSRLDKPNSKFFGTCNPEAPSHFIKKHLDNTTLDTFHEHFTIYDNTTLAPEFVQNLENEYRGTVYFDKWILGKWVANEGLVYPLFRRERHYLTPEEFTRRYGLHRIKYVIIGGDGATTNDSTALVPLAVMDNGQAVTLELFYHNPKINGPLSNEQLIPFIQRYLDDLESKYRFRENGVEFCMPVDCAAADLVISLAFKLEERYNVQKYTKKDILLTTDVVNNALGRNSICILNHGGYTNYVRNRFEYCDNPLVVDLESMIWDKDNKGYDPSVPNDCADAFRYAVNAYYLNPWNLWETPNAAEYYKEEQ